MVTNRLAGGSSATPFDGCDAMVDRALRRSMVATSADGSLCQAFYSERVYSGNLGKRSHGWSVLGRQL